jgi:hypothetical protein
MKTLTLFFSIILIITILQILDVALTFYGVKKGLKETNTHYGTLQSILKIILPFLAFIAYAFLINGLTDPEKLLAEIVFFTVWTATLVFYIIVVLWNIHLVLKVI